jgi:hypothetical protein
LSIIIIAVVAAAPYWRSAAAGVAIFMFVLLLVSVSVVLFAIFAMIRPGTCQLSEVDSRFRICYTGAALMLVGLVILVLGLIVLAAAFAAAGFSPEATWGAAVSGFILALGVLLIGGIISLIGNILTFVVGAFKPHSRYKNLLYAAAGILFALDAVLLFAGSFGVLTLVGYILIYAALKRTLFSS